MKGAALLDATLRRSPFQDRFDRGAATKLSVLAYHAIASPEPFTRQLDYLAERSCPISIEQLHAAIYAGRELPRRPVLVTFDDADPTILEIAAPLLQERSIPAVAFVVSGVLDTNDPFWWDEVADLVASGARLAGRPRDTARELVRHLKRVPDRDRREAIAQLRATAVRAAAPARQLSSHDLGALRDFGVAIGSHSRSHPCLDRCDDDAINVELSTSRDALERAASGSVTALAYPNGNRDDRVVASARRAGYQLGFLFDHRLSAIVPPDPLAISRVRVNAWTSLDRFAGIVSGLHPAIHHAVGRR